ncbi:MAG: class I SAM-dependent methyltransferase [Clostridiaceae bacterium]
MYMQNDGQRIHPRERLSCAIELLGGARVVADVGCDHGRLSCTLIQQEIAQRCIAIDISEPSLQKAERLIRRVGLQERIETRLGDGLKMLQPGEADAIAILGMGGTLIAQILDVTPPLMGATKCVMQPMRGAEDIRKWLYERNYPVLEDRVVFDADRYYQVFSVGAPSPESQDIPAGWPENCFSLGYTAFEKREPLMKQLASQMLATTRRKLRSQRAEALVQQAAQLEQILEQWDQER